MTPEDISRIAQLDAAIEAIKQATNAEYRAKAGPLIKERRLIKQKKNAAAWRARQGRVA